MHYTVAEHYADSDDRVPIDDRRQFDTDLRRNLLSARPTRRRASRRSGSSTGTIVRSCRGSRIGRAKAPSVVRSLIDHLARRAGELDLRVGGARGVDADRADRVRHGGRHESPLHTHARSNVARLARREAPTRHEDRRCSTPRTHWSRRTIRCSIN